MSVGFVTLCHHLSQHPEYKLPEGKDFTALKTMSSTQQGLTKVPAERLHREFTDWPGLVFYLHCLDSILPVFLSTHSFRKKKQSPFLFYILPFAQSFLLLF